MTEKEKRQPMTAARLAEILEVLDTQVTMLRCIVNALTSEASPRARRIAIGMITDAAEREPRFARDPQSDEWARRGAAELAASWIAILGSD